MSKRTAILFVALWALSARAMDSGTFSSAIKEDLVGLNFEDAEVRSQYLDWARAFVGYRHDGPNGEGLVFIKACHDDLLTKKNIFCRLLTKTPEVKARLTPELMRKRYFAAVLKLDAEAKRAENCRTVMPMLDSVVADKDSGRLHARSLYWLWTCARALNQDVKRVHYRETLWRLYPFDHHTSLVLEAEKDMRRQEAAADSRELPLNFRSQKNPDANDLIAGLEAFYLLGENRAALYFIDAVDSDLRQLEPEVRMYLASLAARISTNMSSLLPVTKLLVPLIAENPHNLTRATIQTLFPTNYMVFESRRGRKMLMKEIIETYHDAVPAPLLTGLIHVESGFDPYAASNAKAAGLLQIVTETADDEYQTESGNKNVKVGKLQLEDPVFNLKLGVNYLERLLGHFNGSWQLALASYNSGEGNVRGCLDGAPALKDPQVQIDVLCMSDVRELHASDYVSSVMGKTDWYSLLYY